MNISTYLVEKKRLIDQALEKILQDNNGLNSTLTRMMRYAVFPGGKRIRPILALASAEAVGGDCSAALNAGCAVELVHCSSLVHDDLPSMDDDDLRRGKPTVHKVVGEGVAILIGDALLALPFEVIAQSDNLSAPVRLELIRELAKATGREGIIGGQTVDLESEGKSVSEETLRYIHQHKTADLITAAVRMGAISGSASAEQLELLTQYGNKLGLLFQVVDDILGVTGDTAQLGKQAGADEALKKATYPAVVGLDESREIAQALAAAASESIASFSTAADPLREIVKLVSDRED